MGLFIVFTTCAVVARPLKSELGREYVCPVSSSPCETDLLSDIGKLDFIGLSAFVVELEQVCRTKIAAIDDLRSTPSNDVRESIITLLGYYQDLWITYEVIMVCNERRIALVQNLSDILDTDVYHRKNELYEQQWVYARAAFIQVLSSNFAAFP